MAKRILIFSLAYHPMVGGAEVAIKEITDRLPDIEFDMVTLRFSSDHLKFEKIGNINVYRIGGPENYLNKILFIPQAAIFAFKRRYDCYWAMMTYMLFPIVLMRIFGNKTPYVLTLQDGDPFEHVFGRARIFPFLPLLFYGFRRASRVQAISKFLTQWARNMGYKGVLEIIPNGVDINNFQFRIPNFQEDTITLITTSRLVKKNAVGDIIEALKYLPENVKLKILGSGPLLESLQLKVNSLQLGHRVAFLGEISQTDLPKYLSNADIFVRPSLSEGQGISFIEAMASGLPVIATPVGGIPDFLKDPATAGQAATGLFCEVGNPRSIAEQVSRLVNDKSLRERVVANARKMVEERYDWNLIAQEMRSKVFNT